MFNFGFVTQFHTNSDLIFQTLCLLSQFLHFTHGNGCQVQSITDTGSEIS